MCLCALAPAPPGHTWDPYDVEELRGKVLGVVGYGDIGQACARLARAFRMKVVALRRRTTLSAAEAQEGLVVGGNSAMAHSQGGTATNCSWHRHQSGQDCCCTPCR